MTKQEQDEHLINLLWDYLAQDPDHKDRVQTAYGTKTRQGLAASIRRCLEC